MSPLRQNANPTGGGCKPLSEQGLTKSKKTESVGKPENLGVFLRGGGRNDPDLERVIARWPALSAELKAAISRMIG